MSLSLLFGAGRNKTATIAELELDATISESHDREASVTAFPVERGALVTDHVYPNPKRVSLEGFITASPLRILGLGSGYGEGDRRVTSAFEILERLHESGELVTIATGLTTYTNMAMERLNIPRDRSTGKSLRFTADFVEVKLVETSTVDLSKERVSAASKDLASPREDHGQQAVTEADDPTQSQLLKIVDSLADSLRKLMGAG